MNKQPEQIEDPHELDILRAINRGEQKIADVDWQSYLSHLVVLIHLMKGFSPIGVVWTFLNEIDDFTKRMDILGRLQDLAPKCFPSKEAADAFISDIACLVRINIRLRELTIQHSAKIPDIYNQLDIGGNGFNEMALIWSDELIGCSDLVALASEIHNTVQAGYKAPLIEYFLYSSRNYNQLPFDNIYIFSCNLFLAENFRWHLVTGKMNTNAPLGFVDIKRRMRNGCFDEYIRLRLAQIKEEMDEDNTLLLDPTIDDYYNRLYEEEYGIYNRETMFENFRGSRAYNDRWYNGRPEVLEMMKYFMEYLKWKKDNIHTSDSQPHQRIYNVQGDFVQGNKHVDTQINHVASNAIGAQINKS